MISVMGRLELSEQESDMIQFVISKDTRSSRLLLNSQSNESGERKGSGTPPGGAEVQRGPSEMGTAPHISDQIPRPRRDRS